MSCCENNKRLYCKPRKRCPEMKAIIIENEIEVIQMLESSLKLCCPFLNIKGSADDCQKAAVLMQRFNPELVFININLLDEIKFNFLSDCNKANAEMIFIADLKEDLIKTINFSAAGYLIKPVHKLDLLQAVGAALHRLYVKGYNNEFVTNNNGKQQAPQNYRIAIPKMNGYDFIGVEQIIRCEGDKDLTKVYLENKKTIHATRNLKEMYSILARYGFARVHQSHIINLHKMTQYFKGEGGYVKMTDSSVVDISRRRKKSFMEDLKDLNMI